MMRLAIVSLFSLLLLAVPAHADSVDGDWCADDGRSLTISGPQIRIPSGAQITGEYGRHSFRYIGPAGDPEEAQDVRMQLWSEEDLRIQRVVDGVMQPVEQWKRCKPIA